MGRTRPWRIAPLLLAAAASVALAVGRSAAEPAASAGLIRTRAAVFDPLRGAAPDFAGQVPDGPLLRPERAGTRPVFLLQLEHPVTRATRARLAARGVEALAYVPDRTLLVRPPAGAPAGLLESIEGHRWSGSYREGHKLEPDLARGLGERRSSGATLTVDAFLFSGEDAAALARAVERHFASARVVHVLDDVLVRVAVEVEATALAPLVGALVRDDAVQLVARRAPLETHNDQAVWIGQSYDRLHGPLEAAEPDPKAYALSATIWQHGLTGQGQIVAVADTGLEHALCFFEDPAVAVVPQSVQPPAPLVVDPSHRKLLAYNAPSAGSLSTDDAFRHGTHTSASAVGDSLAHLADGPSAGHDHGDGMAPAAQLVFEDLSGNVNAQCSTSIVVASMTDLLEQEYAAGARISSNSWGSAGGAFDGTSLEATAGAWAHEDLAVFVSAGNNGGGGLVGLAACKNCIAVGASETWNEDFLDAFGTLDPENMAAFSSRGPTADGRIKPDVTAPGFRVASARFPVSYIIDEGDPACDAADPAVCLPGFGGCYVTDTRQSCHVAFLQGTSMSCPLAAGLGALARQYFTEGFHPTGEARPEDVRLPSAALLKAVMINGARSMTGRLLSRAPSAVDLGPLADAPSNVQGWGRVMLDDALHFAGDARRLEVVDVPNAGGLAAGEASAVQLAVSSAAQPLELTLVWSDAPAAPTAAGELVNDLDLLLVAPDGTEYRGNQFTADDAGVAGDKRSAPNPTGKDAVNNVEGILLPAPQPGLWAVAIVAADVPDASGRQGFALVATGAVAPCTSVAPPDGLAAAAAGGERIDLAWEAVPGALGYSVRRNASGCSAPLAADHVVALPAGVTVWADTAVLPQTAYHYTVRAVTTAEGCQTADSVCATATTPVAGPPPVPDGTFGAPVRASRADPAGTAIEVLWDAASCPAAGYHLLHGPLAGVGTAAVDGAACALAPTGSFTWRDAPPGDLWFLVVSDDGAASEGTWGTRSDGTPRGLGLASGECGMLARDDTAGCR